MNGVAPSVPASVGLSEAEARERLRRDGPNALPDRRPRSLWAIAGTVMKEPMFLTLLFAGAIYLAINFLLTRLVYLVEYWLSPHLRQPVPHHPAVAPASALKGDAR